MSRHARGAASAIVLSALLLIGGEAFAQGGKRPNLTGTFDTGGVTSGAAPEKAKAGVTICAYACAPGQGSGLRLPPPEPPTYKAEFLAKVKDLRDRQVDEDPTLRCEAPGVPRIGPPQKIVQTDREVVFLYNDVSGPFFRLVPITAKHRDDLDATPLGDSIGRWEGDTLVVETTKLSDDTWLADNGAFHTEKLRVVERVRIVGDALEWQATAYDPDVLAEPYAKKARTMARTKAEIVVAPQCVDRSLAQMQDKSFHGNPR